MMPNKITKLQDASSARIQTLVCKFGVPLVLAAILGILAPAGVSAQALGANTITVGSAAGSSSVVLRAAGPWSATANDSFLHFSSGGASGSTSGTGNAVVVFTFDALTSPGTRTGTLTIAGLTLTVTQVGTNYAAANPVTTLLSAPSAYPYPTGAALDGSGNFYFANPTYHTIEEWSASTQQVTGLISSGLSEPAGVAVDGSGNVYIADSFDHAIKEWSPSQGLTTLVSSGLSGPQGLAVDGSSNVYIADYGNNAIKEWSPSQGLTTLVSSGLAQPNGVAVDASGSVYIADLGDSMIKEWNASQGLTTLVSSGLNSPQGVAVDGSGNVYITDTLNNLIKMWSPSTGAVTTVVSSGLNQPTGVAVDGSGNVYFVDTYGSDVKEISFAFVNSTSLTEPGAAGADSVQVLPATTPLNGVFAATSDQSWLTVGTASNGVVNFSFLPNTSGASRMAHITVLGRQITVTQNELDTITFGALANQWLGTPPFSVSATASSGLPVSFNSQRTSVCTVSGATVTLVALGSCTVQATDGVASPVNQSFQVIPPGEYLQVFTYIGSSPGISYVVPAGVASLTASLWGAGGGEYGGSGGFSTGSLAVTPGETLTLVVGGGGSSAGGSPSTAIAWGGFGGGGNGYGGNGGSTGNLRAGGGGGRSAILRGSTELITAGAGGGGNGTPNNYGGAGGGAEGAAGGATGVAAAGGGTQTTPGSGGNHNPYQAGSQYEGGIAYESGGGGGGGWYGGGAGGGWTGAAPTASMGALYHPRASVAGSPLWGGGGGGSGYIPTPGVTGGVSLAGQNGTSAGVDPANFLDPNYQAGIGRGGGAGVAGGNGLIVLIYYQQTITFGALAPRALDAGPFSVSATALSGLPVSFNSQTTGVCTVSGSQVTLVAVGTCTIQATQAGNSIYPAAQPVTQSFQVTPGSQTINFGPLSNQPFGATPFTVNASASSGLQVAFNSLTTPVCTVSGATVTLVAPGACTIQATQSGNANYTAAPSVTQTFTVTKATPIITWPSPAAITFGSALGNGQLGAAANVPGAFVYTPPAGTVLLIGSGQTLSVTFTPSDSVDYAAVTAATTINVNPAPPSGVNLVATKVLQRTGGYVVVQLTLANTGLQAANNVVLTSVKVGSTSGTPLPQSIGAIGAGAIAQAIIRVPGTVGASGAASSLTGAGTYTGGTFSFSMRITLP